MGLTYRPCVLLSGSPTMVFRRVENWEQEDADTELEWGAEERAREEEDKTFGGPSYLLPHQTTRA